MSRVDGVSGAGSLWLGLLHGFIQCAALVLGLCVLREETGDLFLTVVFVSALTVLGLAGALYHLFGLERVSLNLLHLCAGFLLGLLCFLSAPSWRLDWKEETSNILLLASVAVKLLRGLLGRLLGSTRYCPAFLTPAEWLGLAGFCTASRLTSEDSLSIHLLVMGVAAVMVTLRVKVILALVNLACFAAVGGYFFSVYPHVTNPFALSCFFGQLICDPLLDFYFSGLSVTERWQPLLLRTRLWRHLSLLPLLAVEVLFVVVAAQKPAFTERWYLTVPGLVLCLVLWAVWHLVFFTAAWGFHVKLSDCQRLYRFQGSEASRLDKVMASKGMRHLCLISERLLVFTLASTVAVAVFSWQASSRIFLSVLLLVLPLESLFHGLFRELGNSLGGTCVGYALVIPTNYCSPDGQPLLLPPDQVQELNRRSTGMLNNIQRFFAHHVIESFGCDYSSSGVTLEALQAKMKAFLELRTADGPRHDTYIIFYSGHTHQSGDWALAGGDALRLGQILNWWRETNGTFSSRLILVLDCENSLPWVKGVRNVEGLYVAVQGAVLARGTDVELQRAAQLGDFSSQWVEYNCRTGSIQWLERTGAVDPVYGISKHWGDYTLRLPSGSDVTDNWCVYFPRVTYPLVRLALWCGSLDLLWLCSACLRCLRRLKLNWFPPAILDTGQGFKLVGSQIRPVSGFTFANM